MKKTELSQYHCYTVKYQGQICLEEAAEQEARDYIDRAVESGQNRNDFEMLEEDVVEIIPPQGR